MVFYKWLVSRKVFYVEDFPIRLDVLEDLVTVLDMESHCPVLRSIEISRWIMNQHPCDLSQVKSNLSVFLSHCHNLREATVSVEGFTKSMCDAVLSVLVEKLRENSLVKISLGNIETHHDSNVMITDFITKHASSLRVLYISTLDGVDMDFIISTLIENEICLRQLTVSLGGDLSQVMPSLMSYLSSSGGLLEEIYASPFGNSWVDCYWTRK
eukprot:scaffold2278_cov171-Ochromonas_danica.AAC.4